VLHWIDGEDVVQTVQPLAAAQRALRCCVLDAQQQAMLGLLGRERSRQQQRLVEAARLQACVGQWHGQYQIGCFERRLDPGRAAQQQRQRAGAPRMLVKLVANKQV